MPATSRLFAAVIPPDEAIEDLAEFLRPRIEATPELRWTRPEQWHVTCAFAPEVPDYLLDDLGAALEQAAARRALPALRLAGGGAFPDPDHAKVLWTAPEPVVTPAPDAVAPAPEATAYGQEGVGDDGALAALAARCRTAFATTGIEVDGGRFRAHVTLARSGRPVRAMRWLRVLEAYAGPVWRPDRLSLVASHLGEGPRRSPRYEVVGEFPLGARARGF